MTSSSKPNISNIKVTYLNGRGKGQMIRILLRYLEVEFQDIIVEQISDSLRATLPYGQLPIFEATINDDQPFLLAQCNSICRYIAEKYDFAGKTDESKALSDEVINGIWDLIVMVVHTKDEEARLKLNSITLPKFLNAFESKLTKNKFVSGEETTYADLLLFTAYDYIEFLGVEIERSKYPKLEELKSHFDSFPQIIDYKNKLPITKF
ncbi:hypothetical protein RB653_002175 [Dictyostelium firmibasis]|uniref:Glutathione S-transferase n=1 Tax=Dictyostelium firmibasis TaxID=79012 RepID=A0AAN7YYJ3_9MYCE